MRCTRGERRLTRRVGHCWIDMECRLGFWEGGTCFLQTSRKRVLGQRHSQRITRSKSLPQSSFYARTDQVYRGILNFCCPYTSQEEMATAIKTTIDACHTGQLSPSSVPALSKTHSLTRQSREITESTLSSNLYTSASPLSTSSSVHPASPVSPISFSGNLTKKQSYISYPPIGQI